MEYAIYPFNREGKYRLHVRFKDQDGERVTRSLGITYPLDHSEEQLLEAEKKAEEVAPQIVLRYFKEKGIQEQKKQDKPQLSTYLEEHYYPNKRSECAKSTLVSYQGALNHFIRIVGDHPIDSYDREKINQFKLTRFNDEDIKKTTINIELRSIKAAFSWAAKNNLLAKTPYRGEEFLFNAKSKKRAFNHYEIEKLLKVTEGKMIGLVIRLAYCSGMRIGEMSYIKWSMINLEGPHIRLPKEITKTDKSRAVPLSKSAFNIVKIFENVLKKKMKNNPEEYENKVKQECYLLQKQRGHGRYSPRSIQQKFRRCMNDAGLPKELTFHCLRHSFATHILENEKSDLLGLSKVLGHTTPTVTEEFYDHTEALNYRHIPEMLPDF